MANEPIRVEYNQDLKPLEELLAKVNRAGAFFVSSAIEIPLPKIEVAGVGVLSFPVPPAQVAALVQQATRAPYGRGEQTIVDESVRKVWQLPPDKVRIGGKSWPASFGGILAQVTHGLGCEGLTVSAELYKLLVYESGGFFLAHRDTEKAEGMFGTLILALPSLHRGGELAIRHAGREATVDLSQGDNSEISFAAFYADCEHEVRPIKEGSRVCLVYNLIQQRGAKAKGRSLGAPDYGKEITAAAELLEQGLIAPDAPAKIAWLLEHQYTPDGLCFRGLKGADAARAKVLAQAAERAGCALHLGIVHIEEYGAAQEVYRPRRWGRYRDAEEEETEDAGDEFEVIEVCDGWNYISQWRDPGDQPVAFGKMPLAPGELLPEDALEGEKPDEQRFTEATGNEGASFERAYHRAALVIWRRDRYAEVLLQAGVAAALPYFRAQLAQASAENAPPEARAAAVALARRLVEAWQAAPDFASHGPRRPEKREEMLGLLNQLGDGAVLEQFIAEVVTRDYDASDNAGLAASTRLLAPKKTARLCSELISRHLGHLPGDCVGLLHELVFTRELAADKPLQPALREIAEAAVNQLDDLGKKGGDDEWLEWGVGKAAVVVDAALIAKLMDVLGALKAPALRAAAAKKFAARPEVFDPVTVLVPALRLIRERDDAVEELWTHCAGFVLKRSGVPPEAPRDWRQEVKLSCSCADCRELQTFVSDPVEQTHRFRVRQDRRQHLHQTIDRHKLDMTHVTDRKGSPQTLVCTKNRRSYQRRCDQYRKDVAALAALTKLANQTGAAAWLDKIEAARLLAAQWSPA